MTYAAKNGRKRHRPDHAENQMSNHKLRLKYPSGAEFEAEGPAEFILSEKADFLAGMATPTTSRPTAQGPAEMRQEPAFWDRIIDQKGPLRLRIKTPEISAVDAVLILMAANRAISLKEDMSAITLSKALKTSGYEPDRLDRLLIKEIREGRITASGTKRNRTYRLTQKGIGAAAAAIARLPKDT